MNRPVFIGLFVAVIVVCLLLIFGIRSTSDVMAYDANKIIDVKGTIVSTNEFSCPASDGELGRHLMLKTADHTYEIHLAPSRVLRANKWDFKVGQQVQIIGAQVRYKGKDGLIAKQLTMGEDIYTFRDMSGKLLVQQ